MKFTKLPVLLSLCVLPLGLVACSSSPKSQESSKSAEVKKSDEKPAEVQKDEASSSLSLNTIYFDFDKYNIREDQSANAKATADSLKANPKVKIQIQGNTDDRGSVEYNLALGTRRAESLKKFFVAAGVSKKNISIVSYGKERPAVQGDNEDAWSKNRRDDVVEQK